MNVAGKSRDGLIFAGFMCGTSLDGIDGSLIGIRDGRITLLAFEQRPFSPYVTKWLRRFLGPDPDFPVARYWGDVENLLARVETDLLSDLLAKSRVSPNKLHGAGSHGITVYHHPHPHPPPWEEGSGPGVPFPGLTVQIANPYLMARSYRIPVVFDFRRADLYGGGEGAPLTPLFHRAAFSDPHESLAFLNLGGIANLTSLPPLARSSDPVAAFDTGPGNMLMDLAVSLLTHGKMTHDKDGEYARKGTVRPRIVSYIMSDPWFSKPPPKSTGREEWGPDRLSSIIEYSRIEGEISENDLLASLSEATALGIRRGIEWISPAPVRIVAGGGGTRNPDLMDRIRRITGLPVGITDDSGWPSQAIESMAFAYLAALTLSGRTGSLPSTTGCRSPVLLGGLAPPPDGSLADRLLEIRDAAGIHLPFPDRAISPT